MMIFISPKEIHRCNKILEIRTNFPCSLTIALFLIQNGQSSSHPNEIRSCEPYPEDEWSPDDGYKCGKPRRRGVEGLVSYLEGIMRRACVASTSRRSSSLDIRTLRYQTAALTPRVSDLLADPFAVSVRASKRLLRRVATPETPIRNTVSR